MSVFDEIPRSRALTPRVQTMPNARGIVAKPPALPAPPRGLATVPGQGRRTTANARGAGGFKNEIGRQGRNLVEQRRLLGAPGAQGAARGGAASGLAGAAQSVGVPAGRMGQLGAKAGRAFSGIRQGLANAVRGGDGRVNAVMIDPQAAERSYGRLAQAGAAKPRNEAELLAALRRTPVQEGPQDPFGLRAGQAARATQAAQAEKANAIAQRGLAAWDVPNPQFSNTRAAMGPNAWTGEPAKARSLADVPTTGVQPSAPLTDADRTAKGLMQTTLNGGAYRYTPSAEEQATLGKASYSDNLQGAAPMASGAQVRAWEQPGALEDAPMRGGFVGSNGLTDEDRAENLAYWQKERQGVTQDIQRRGLAKAAFNPGMDRVDREGNIDTSMRQAAFAGLAGMAGGAATEKAGEGKAKGTEDWKRAVALEAMKGGNALELEAMKQAGTSAETFRTLRNDQQKAVIDAVGFALPEPQEGGLGGVGAGGGGVTAGQRALALAFTSRLATQRGEDALSNPFALTQIAGTVGQAVQQYPYADYGAALAAARAEVKNPKQAEELAALFQKEQMAALEAALFGSGEAEKQE